MTVIRRMGSRPWALMALFVFIAFPVGLAAQGGVAGTVTDEASLARLAAVLVEVIDAGGAVAARGITGPAGAYRINDVAPGTYTIRFTSPGWSTSTVAAQSISAGQLTNVSTTMTEQSFSLNPITVTASKTEEKTLDAPAAVAVVSRRDIEETQAISIADHVRDQPGVDVIDTGVQSSYTVVRGFNNIFSGATLTMTDNRIARVPSLRANISHFNPVTNLDLERIEVVLGPGSALYGPNAANGVIHNITKSPIDYPGASFSMAGGLRQQQDGASFTGEDKGLFHGEGRIALRSANQKVGFKVSGQYFQGTEYAFVDQAEAAAQLGAQGCVATDFDLASAACQAFAGGLNLADPADQQLLRESVLNAQRGRSNDLERWSVDARLDIRPTPQTAIVLSGGRNNALNSVDLTGLGAGQVVDWAYNYLQGRVNHKDLFAQVFYNKSDNENSFLLRNGRPLIDKSSLFVAQVQHSSTAGQQHRFIYGVDLLRTSPDTEGTINGQNEADDQVTEIGGYAQWEWSINPKWDFVAAARLDNNSRLEDPVFSPRAGIVFKPDLANSLRFTFNRAFSTPTSLNLFLDVSGGTVPVFGPFTYDIRATGSTDLGHMFMRDANGPMHMSPFNVLLGGSSRDFLPTTTGQLWTEAVAAVGVIDPMAAALLGLIAAPGDADVGILPLLLDPGIAAGGPAPSDCDAPASYVAVGFCHVTPLAGIQDVPRLKPTITNTLELGYKGLLGGRTLIGINGWWSHISDFTSALRLASSNLFLNGQDLGAYLTQQFLPLVGTAFPDAATAQATAATLAGTIASVPLGTVTPQSVGGTTSGMAFVYENLGSVDVLGAEIGATFVLNDQFELITNLSVVDKNQFQSSGPTSELIPLNAPTVKGSAALTYRDDDAGLNGGLRFRAQNGFGANSGVYVGDVESFEVVDAGFGFRVPGWQDLWFQLDVQNVFDNAYQTFVGVPELGRMILARVRYDYSPF